MEGKACKNLVFANIENLLAAQQTTGSKELARNNRENIRNKTIKQSKQKTFIALI